MLVVEDDLNFIFPSMRVVKYKKRNIFNSKEIICCFNARKMKPESNWKERTLEDMEKEEWGNADATDTGLVKHIMALRKVPLSKFSVEDMRRMIGQQFSLDYLVPLALGTLEENLFAEGDFYEGDLLCNVLEIKPEFWEKNRHYWSVLDGLIRDRLEEIRERHIGVEIFYSVKD